VSRDSADRARDLIARVIDRAASLDLSPRRGRKVPEFNRDEIREVSEPPYRVIYRLRTDSIDIITVMHVRQLIPADLIDLHGANAP